MLARLSQNGTNLTSWPHVTPYFWRSLRSCFSPLVFIDFAIRRTRSRYRSQMSPSPGGDQVLRVNHITEPFHAFERCVVAFFGVGADAIADDNHKVTAMIAVPHRGFDPAVGGATDHHDRIGSPIREHGLELIADEHGRAPLVDDDVVLAGLKRFHDLPAEAAVKPAPVQR